MKDAAADTLSLRPPSGEAKGMVLDTRDRTVTLQGREIALSGREFELLHALLRNAGRVLSRAQLERHLHVPGRHLHSNAIEVHVHHLRRKLGAGVIDTVRGEGYVLRREPSPAR